MRDSLLQVNLYPYIMANPQQQQNPNLGGDGAGLGGQGGQGPLANVQQFVLTPAMFQQLMANQRPAGAGPPAGGFRKLAPLKSADPIEWDTWRKTFEQTVICNAWDHSRARRELYASMEGEAHHQVRNIPVNAVPDANGVVPPVQDMLNEYQERFVPESAITLARERFRAARQKSEETNNQFHNRVRYLWTAANPNAPANDLEGDRDAREVFLFGLRNEAVREQTAMQHPETFTRCLALANSNEATIRQLQRRNPYHRRGIHALSAPSTAAMDKDKNTICWHCNDKGHVKRNCPLLRNKNSSPSGSKNKANRAGGRGQQNGRGRGRGGSRGRGGRSTGGRPLLGAMGEPEEDDERMYDEAEEQDHEDIATEEEGN